MKRALRPHTLILLCGVFGAQPAVAGSVADTGVDDYTIALWLFDEPSYGNMTLTDAGPHQIERWHAAIGKWLRTVLTAVEALGHGLSQRWGEEFAGVFENRVHQTDHHP